MSKKYNIGIIGGGRIAYVHAKSLVSLGSDINVALVSDPFLNDETKAKFKELGVNEFTKNNDDIFNNENIDIVYICSPTDTHKDLIIRALKANKHVFSEKPLSLNIKEILEIKEAAKSFKKTFFVGFNRRFDKNFSAVKKAIDDGIVGKVQSIHVTSRDPGLPPVQYLKGSGGLFADMMIHDLDMALFLNPAKPKAVFALGAALIDPEVATVANDVDSANVLIEFEDGTMANITNSRKATYGYDQRVEVHGSKSTVSIGNETSSTLVISSEAGVNFEKPLHFFLERYQNAYDTENRLFIEAVKGKIKSPTSIEDGLLSMVLAKAAEKSLKEKRLVPISEVM